MSVYDYTVMTNSDEEKSLADFHGNVLLIVNTASKCGFTPQYEGLQMLYDTYKDHGFTVLGFPSNQFMNQEPGSGADIEQFCKTNYGVSFPIFRKIDVKGKNIHPLFQYLINQAPGFLFNQVKWNFTKFLIDRNGQVVKRYAPNIEPLAIETAIQELLD
ncbi:glutathione peroxidase [Aquibacillus salsiterrae]|uniref:Glutathione peroxidase n=1 Tax=Aquibacillus salsiterrae TaxID=2950439 RepID=A0A9X4AGG3_9BACI|nr:glutathione peroxidase [Aquibacillus salsiterrae]MDC3417068.1 glutathione peroxidase [Aquibacillus salsiterrae]